VLRPCFVARAAHVTLPRARRWIRPVPYPERASVSSDRSKLDVFRKKNRSGDDDGTPRTCQIDDFRWITSVEGLSMIVITLNFSEPLKTIFTVGYLGSYLLLVGLPPARVPDPHRAI
jgi:hypothetical protein